MYIDLFKPKTYFRCPICGAVLDSDDDFVYIDAGGSPSNKQDISGCSRCLTRVSVDRIEEIYANEIYDL